MMKLEIKLVLSISCLLTFRLLEKRAGLNRLNVWKDPTYITRVSDLRHFYWKIQFILLLLSYSNLCDKRVSSKSNL